ncbi:MAG TPA: SDR family oxidoreductase [Bryobacteraceae bacterium]|nr:SDR family oxidoreductase [Bryobacteraceae bacterium]
MSFDPRNKCALITGASSGIGLELARQLAPRVVSLVLVARRTERLDTLARELESASPALRVLVKRCDLADREETEALCNSLKTAGMQVDILVNNAGLGERALVEHSELARMQQMIDVNCSAVVQLTRAFLPSMVERGYGGILNIGSGAGRAAMPNAAVYTASKHFVKAFTESLRAQLQGTGVTVTESAPGPVDTEFHIAAGIERAPDALRGRFTISAEQCARETIAAFERGQAVIYPGQAYRMAMALQPLMPRRVLQRVLTNNARALRGSRTPRVNQVRASFSEG